jgi:aspartate carbamoyltransferase catalytic subunit
MGAEVTVCAPPTLLPAGLRPGQPRSEEPLALPPVHVETDLDIAIEGADVVMALRLQKERMSNGLLPSTREYATLYQLTEPRLARAATGALVMHPGPMNEGVEIAPAVASSLQSVIEEQVTNGVAVRMAVLYLICRSRA